jgi:ankyrin repeat protein/RNAse (barnase) inhibitor barstar
LKFREADNLLDAALRLGDQDKVRKMFTDDYFIISAETVGKAMRIGLDQDDVELFTLAVEHQEFHKVDVSFGFNLALRYTIKNELDSLFDILMKHPMVDPYDLGYRALWMAKSQGREYFVKRLLTDHRIHTVNRNNESFLEACRYGEVGLVESLLKDKNINLESNKGLSLAAEFGHVEVVKILLAHECIDPGYSDNKVLKRACLLGREEVVKLLLKDPRVNPRGSLSFACKVGHVSMIKAFLEDPRIHNQFDMNHAMGFAIKNGQYEIVEYLLENTTINFEIGEINPIVMACEQGNARILKRLVCDHRYKKDGTSFERLQTDLNKGLLEAVKRNYASLVDFLLSETIATPNGKDFNAAQVACRFGHKEILERLLKDPRVFITEKCIFKAAANNHKNIVKFLLEIVEEDSVPRMLEAAREGAKRAHYVKGKKLADTVQYQM